MKTFGRGLSAWDKIRAEQREKKIEKWKKIAVAGFAVAMMSLGAGAAKLIDASMRQEPEAQVQKQPNRPQDAGKKPVAEKRPEA